MQHCHEVADGEPVSCFLIGSRVETEGSPVGGKGEGAATQSIHTPGRDRFTEEGPPPPIYGSRESSATGSQFTKRDRGAVLDVQPERKPSQWCR